ncbi:MAG: hypothetical protein WA199_18795 [Xanthobacteraceae bacterium]
MHPSLGLRGAILGLCFFAGACAPAPTLRSVLWDHYPGYDQLSPASGVLLDESRYEYLPGNVIALELAAPRTAHAAAAWNDKSSIYCPINIPLSALTASKRSDAYVVHNFDFSLRRALGLKKAKADLNLEDNELEILRRVEITVSSARIYRLKPGQRPKFELACMNSIAGKPDLTRLRSILAGDVHVKILFKDNVSLIAKLAVANKIQGNLGFGYLRGFNQDYSATNMVFAAKVSPTRVRSSH